MTIDNSLSLVLITPETRKNLAGVTFDAFKVVSGGRSIADLLSHVLIGRPESVVNDDTGAQEVVYTLAIPPGAGLAIPLRPVGEIGVAHKERGVLSITCPKAMNGVFTELLQSRDIQTSAVSDVAHQDGVMSQFFVRTTPGMSFGMSFPGMGTVRIARP